MQRRSLLQASLATLPVFAFAAHAQQNKSVLLRSSWQTVNIGDIAHTPGVLTLLEKHLPQVQVRLWPSDVSNGVKELLLKRFPKLVFVQTAAEQEAAFRECDFLLHGSGPSLVAEKDLLRWHEKTGKPFGVFGITLPSYPAGTTAVVPTTNAQHIDILSAAKFVYFRDTVSLKLARDKKCAAPVMEFGPDGAFAVDLRNNEFADTFIKENALAPGKYLCCIPRLRNTPYWLIKKGRAFDEAKHARNEAMKEHDHAPLRTAIEAVVNQTDYKVILCPEDASQMAVAKEMLWDKLPDSVRQRVVRRDKFWLTDEALSIYVQSAGLFGLEMHSPIMCIGNGIPAIVGRFAEQTSKGFMWRDIGLEEWLFDMDVPAQVKKFVPTVLSLLSDTAAAQQKAAQAREKVAQLHTSMMQQLAKELGV